MHTHTHTLHTYIYIHTYIHMGNHQSYDAVIHPCHIYMPCVIHVNHTHIHILLPFSCIALSRLFVDPIHSHKECATFQMVGWIHTSVDTRNSVGLIILLQRDDHVCFSTIDMYHVCRTKFMVCVHTHSLAIKGVTIKCNSHCYLLSMMCHIVCINDKSKCCYITIHDNMRLATITIHIPNQRSFIIS